MQHWITTTVSTFQGFIYFQGGQSANVYFSDNGRATETLGDIFLGLSVLIGDSMIVSSCSLTRRIWQNTHPLHLQIYRLLVVWCYRKVVIIIPVLSMVGLLSMVYFHWPMILLIGVSQLHHHRPDDDACEEHRP
jgi:hypothetical protein